MTTHSGRVIARRNDEAIQKMSKMLDCFATLAMTTHSGRVIVRRNDEAIQSKKIESKNEKINI